MSEHPTRELAERIVNDLFGVGGTHEAHRLVLTGKDGRDMGGWGLLPMTDVVERHLRASSLAPVAPALSLSLQHDPLAITEMLDDSTREREMYHRLVLDIRHALGEDGLHAQLLDLPTLIAQKVADRDRVAPPSGQKDEDSATRTGELAADPSPQHASTDGESS